MALRGGDKTSAQQPPSPSSNLRYLSRAPACSGLRRNRAGRKRRASKLIHLRRHNCEQRRLTPHLLALAKRAARADGEGKPPQVLRQQPQHTTKRRLWLQRSRDACPSCVEVARTHRTSCTTQMRRAAQASSPPSQLTQASSRQTSSLQASSAPEQLTPKRVHLQASSRVSLRRGWAGAYSFSVSAPMAPDAMLIPVLGVPTNNDAARAALRRGLLDPPAPTAAPARAFMRPPASPTAPPLDEPPVTTGVMAGAIAAVIASAAPWARRGRARLRGARGEGTIQDGDKTDVLDTPVAGGA